MITTSGRARSAARGLLAVLPALMLLAMGYLHRWVTEDAFIDFRVVKHVLEGSGPVFNVGERVEVYSNPLWVGLVALWGAFGSRLETGAILFGLCLSAGSILLAQIAATTLLPARANPENEGVTVPLGAVMVVAVPVFWDFATSGLETGLSFFWLAVCFWLLARNALPGGWLGSKSVGCGIVLGLGPLIRPDLGIFSVVFVSAFLIQSASSAPSLRTGLVRAFARGASSVALPVMYQGFRMGYFASVVPNPALAKEAGLAFYERGFAYAWDLLRCYALPLPLGLLAGFWAASARRLFRLRAWSALVAVLGPVTAAVVHAAYVVRVGGDFMHGRLLLPSLFAFVLPVATVRLPSTASSERRSWVTIPWIAGAVIVIWACVCASSLRFRELDAPWGIVDERAFYVDRTGIETPTRLEDYDATGSIGEALAAVAKSRRTLVFDDEPSCDIVQVTPGRVLRYCTASPTEPVELPLRSTLDRRVRTVLVHANVGAIGYAVGTRVNVVDRRGLGDALAARLRLPLRGRAGHEKMLGDAWIVARFTDPAPSGEHPAVVAARAALRCADAAELRDATEAPLDASRFIRNMTVAFRLHALRIPEDPAEARKELCRKTQVPSHETPE